MNESADPLVDVPAPTPPVSLAVGIELDNEQGRLTLDFGPEPWSGSSSALDEDSALEELFEELADALLDQAEVALRVTFCGSELTPSLVQKVLRCITQDCDRAVSAVVVSPDLGRHLLSATLHRPVEWAELPGASVLAPSLALADEIPLDTSFSTRAPALVESITGSQVELFDGGEETELDDSDATSPTQAAPTEPADDALSGEPAEPARTGAPSSDSPDVPPVLSAEPTALPAESDSAEEPTPSGDVALTTADEEIVALADASDSPVVDSPAADESDEPDAAGSTDSTRVELSSDSEDDPSRTRAWGDSPEADRRVLALRRTLRSGAIVRFPGDVVLFGDLNAGAQVIAQGDIVVLGKLRGLAHAGSRGDANALVIGLDMRAGQVRIADVIAFPHEEPDMPESGSRLTRLLAKVQPSLPRPIAPTIARLVDGTIRIEDYRGRLHA